MKFNYNDGGRSKYFKGQAGDCVTRAIAIATRMDYKEVYNLVAKKVEAITGTKSARNGVPKKLTKQIMKELGFKCTITCNSQMNYITKNPECLDLLGRYIRPSGKSLESILN